MMESDRTVPRSAILFVAALLAAAVISGGCGRSDRIATNAGAEAGPVEGRPAPSVNHLSKAKRFLQLQNLDAAADSAYKALLQDPDDGDIKLITAEIEAQRGNHQTAVDLVSSIDIKSRLGMRAVDLHFQQLMEMDRRDEAADVLLAGISEMPEVIDWRRSGWQLLNRLGRREEASDQALSLCRAGLANDAELHSLIRRAEAFPISLKEGEEPAEFFNPGLGMARWHSSQQQWDEAIEALAGDLEKDSVTPAALALQGRLLAETQSVEEFPNWHALCDERTREFGNYWAALGTYFYDQREYEASARALLEAVYRDPTDRITFQRLSKVFGTLGRADVGQQFRNRGIKIYETENMSKELLETGDPIHRRDIARNLQLLTRPFELLQWTQSVAVVANQRNPEALQAQIDQQRATMLQMPDMLSAASDASLLDLDIKDYSIESAIDSLRQIAGRATGPQRREVDILAAPRLVNVAKDVGLEFQWYKDVENDFSLIPIHESVGGGICVLDFDLDGWPDVYLAQGAGDPPTDQCTRSNELRRNLSGRFSDVTAAANVQDFNYSSGIAAGDVNQDGFPDLYLGSLGRNRLLINNGDGTFRDATARMGPIVDRFSTSLAIGDINGDRLPDLFESNYIMMDGAFAPPKTGSDGKPVLPGPLDHVSDFDRWFENLGDGTFKEHNLRYEVDQKPGTSLGVILTDFDADGSNEVFVGNDVRPNHFLHHTGDNKLYNAADAKGVANGFQGVPNGCMGIAAADFNRDGAIDMHITNFKDESANLFLQTSGGLYTDFAVRYGIDKLSWPWVGFGTKAVDVDRNGWLDLLVTNGHIFDVRIYGQEYFRMPVQMLMSRGRRFEAVEVDDDSGYWSELYLGRAMSTIDFDRNGSVDILIGHLDEPLALLDNQTSTEGSWIQLELVGTSSERDAVGARVVVTAGGESFTQWVVGGDGYFSSDEAVIDFGLGMGRKVEKVEVFWPGAKQQTFTGLEDGHRYLLLEGESTAWKR